MKRLVLALGLLMAAPVAVHAVQPDEILPDAGMEARARELSKELRCLVCQNQSIDDSNAPLARDLRLIVRERLVQGDSDRQVLDFVTERYGDFVLLQPPFKATTWVLWLAPLLILLVGGVTTARFLRSRSVKGAGGRETVFEAPLSEEENRRLAALLSKDKP